MVRIEKVRALPDRIDKDFRRVRELLITGKASTIKEFEAHPFLAEYPCAEGFLQESVRWEWDCYRKEFTVRIIDRERALQAVKE